MRQIDWIEFCKWVQGRGEPKAVDGWDGDVELHWESGAAAVIQSHYQIDNDGGITTHEGRSPTVSVRE